MYYLYDPLDETYMLLTCHMFIYSPKFQWLPWAAEGKRQAAGGTNSPDASPSGRDDVGRKNKRCLRALLLSPLSCPVLETQRNEVHRSEAKLSEFRSETKRSEAKQLRSQLSCGGSGHHRLETKASLTRTICQIIRFHYVSYQFYVSDLPKTYTRRCPRGPKTATRATRRCSRVPNP